MNKTAPRYSQNAVFAEAGKKYIAVTKDENGNKISEEEIEINEGTVLTFEQFGLRWKLFTNGEYYSDKGDKYNRPYEVGDVLPDGTRMGSGSLGDSHMSDVIDAMTGAFAVRIIFKGLFKSSASDILRATVVILKENVDPIPVIRKKTTWKAGGSQAGNSAARMLGPKIPANRYGKMKGSLIIHHMASNKHKYFTPRFTQITQKYNLNLDDAWNKLVISDAYHFSRHPNEYHEWIEDQMNIIDNIAQGNVQVFLSEFKARIESEIRINPNLVNKTGW